MSAYADVELRKQAWIIFAASGSDESASFKAEHADALLAEFEKRWPTGIETLKAEPAISADHFLPFVVEVFESGPAGGWLDDTRHATLSDAEFHRREECSHYPNSRVTYRPVIA